MKTDEIIQIASQVNFNGKILEEHKVLKSTNIALQSDYEKVSKKYDNLLKLIKDKGFCPKRPIMTNPRRKKIASTQGWKCLECHNMLGASFDIDHKICWIDSFDDSDDNLRALCVDCHRIKTATENSNN